MELAKRDTGTCSVERHGKERRIGLRGEHAAQVLVVALACVDEQTIAFPIERRKERQPLDVVPVGVADQDVRLAFARLELGTHKLFAQATNAGAAVDDDARACRRRDLDARGVTSVALGAGARNGKRATNAPEADSHDQASTCLPSCMCCNCIMIWEPYLPRRLFISAKYSVRPYGLFRM